MAACMTELLLSTVVLISLCWFRVVVCVVDVVVAVAAVVVVAVLAVVDVDVVVKVVDVKVVVVIVDVGTSGANASGFMETAAMPRCCAPTPNTVVMALINPCRNDGE